ncbi:hypothetical protein [Marinobacter salsuginis]|jgi:hypothetical protein|uniref:Uncharacterized protein n=1 Tax=Marinobacter salsuginis TaxID=418719 RepID=A0A5M3Q4R6_9GAMM|nr:hypothetical protein [Marinobacter salsuginis]GBO90176.1 hypothetical protein MSSD14B_38440 [Marinobacter salsuginis]
MSAHELDVIMTIASSINQVLEEYRDDPRLSAIHGRSCVYRAALTRALLTRQGITNTFWSGGVRWAATGQPPRYLDCFERDAAKGDLGGHVCNLAQLRDGTCWLLDITMDQFHRCATIRDGVDLPAIQPPQILLALTPNKRFEAIKKSGWLFYRAFPGTNTWCEYRYESLIGFRRLRKLYNQGQETGLNAQRWPDVYRDILTRLDFRLHTLATLPSVADTANY